MPRPKRTCIPDFPHHVVQRGNNKHETFYNDVDYSRYLSFLRDASIRHGVAVHAYVLMTNHVHLLMTPTSSNGLSQVMQDLGRRFVAYINKAYSRTGTLWEGRFRSSVIDTDHYCLACYRYIDLNPSRAGIVTDPVDYRWSSCRHNSRGTASSLIVPHQSYLQLGNSIEIRATRYRALISESLGFNSLNRIRFGISKCLPVGSDRFKTDIEENLGRRLGTGRIGRPAKT